MSDSPPAEGPVTYRAPLPFRLGLTLFAIIGTACSWLSWHGHQRENMLVTTIMTVALLIVSVLVNALRITLDQDGIIEKTVTKTRRIPWSDIVRMDRARHSYSLYGRDGKDLALVTMLTADGQQAIADEVLEHTSLTHFNGKLPGSISERWQLG